MAMHQLVKHPRAQPESYPEGRHLPSSLEVIAWLGEADECIAQAIEFIELVQKISYSLDFNSDPPH